MCTLYDSKFIEGSLHSLPKKKEGTEETGKKINQYIQGGAPKIAKLVYNSNNYGL